MRGIVAAFAFAGLLPFANATAQNKVNVGHLAAPNIAIRFVGGFAKLTIIGWQRDSVAMIGIIGKGQRLDFYGGSPGERSLGMKMNLDSPESVGSSGTLEMYVPIGARVTIKGGTADIEASGVTGELTLSVVGGSVRVSGNPQFLNIEAMDANVTVDGSPAYVRLNSAAGDIVMHGGSPDAAFQSVSGNIRVSDGVFERAQFENVDGGVTFAGELARVSSMKVDTHGGPIDVTFLGKQPSVRVQASSLTGSIENFLSKTRPVTGKDGRGQELLVEIGSADGHVVITTFKGPIRLSRK